MVRKSSSTTFGNGSTFDEFPEFLLNGIGKNKVNQVNQASQVNQATLQGLNLLNLLDLLAGLLVWIFVFNYETNLIFFQLLFCG